MYIEIQDFHAFTRDSDVLKDSLQAQDSSEFAAVAQWSPCIIFLLLLVVNRLLSLNLPHVHSVFA